MPLLEKFKSWMRAEDETDFPFEPTGYGIRELEPMELVKSAVNSVASNAKEWPDGVDLPDVIEVWLSAQDFEYYGPRRASCEKRIADAVIAYAEEEGALLERVPTVFLQVDSSLLLGEARAQARFSNPDEPIVRPAAAKRVAEPVRTGPVGGVKTQLFRPGAAQVQPAAAAAAQKPGASAAQKPRAEAAGEPQRPDGAGKAAASNNPRNLLGNETPEGAVADAGKARAATATPGESASGNRADAAPCANAGGAETPAFEPASRAGGLTPEFKPAENAEEPSRATAKLVDENRQIEVVDGDTVGCLRQIGEPAPAIALDESDHPYVSQRQALFSCDGETWSLVSLGRNGTSVQRDGAWIELSASVPFVLRDGDRISFARSAPLTFCLS